MGEFASSVRFSRLCDAVTRPRQATLESVPFAELILAHYLRQADVYRERGYDGPHEEPYQAKLRAFTAAHGRIIDAYWCSRAPSAVAVTERGVRSWRRLWARQTIVRFHAETDWITSEASAEIAAQIHACQMLAVRVAEVLRGTTELIAMQSLLCAVERLLALVDHLDEQPLTAALVKQAVGDNQDELKQIGRYYDKAAQNQARLVYFQGMMRGALILAGFVAAATGILYARHFSHWHSPVTQQLVLAVAMGGVGAIISVMSRMAGKGAFSVEYEVGRKIVRLLGSLRPFIGATFAVALFFGFQSGLVQLGHEPRTTYFYGIVSFLAGFSERWARILLERAGSGDTPAKKS
jgi:hypothetical protein